MKNSFVIGLLSKGLLFFLTFFFSNTSCQLGVNTFFSCCLKVQSFKSHLFYFIPEVFLAVMVTKSPHSHQATGSVRSQEHLQLFYRILKSFVTWYGGFPFQKALEQEHIAWKLKTLPRTSSLVRISSRFSGDIFLCLFSISLDCWALKG